MSGRREMQQSQRGYFLIVSCLLVVVAFLSLTAGARTLRAVERHHQQRRQRQQVAQALETCLVVTEERWRQRLLGESLRTIPEGGLVLVDTRVRQLLPAESDATDARVIGTIHEASRFDLKAESTTRGVDGARLQSIATAVIFARFDNRQKLMAALTRHLPNSSWRPQGVALLADLVEEFVASFAPSADGEDRFERWARDRLASSAVPLAQWLLDSDEGTRQLEEFFLGIHPRARLCRTNSHPARLGKDRGHLHAAVDADEVNPETTRASEQAPTTLLAPVLRFDWPTRFEISAQVQTSQGEWRRESRVVAVLERRHLDRQADIVDTPLQRVSVVGLAEGPEPSWGRQFQLGEPLLHAGIATPTCAVSLPFGLLTPVVPSATGDSAAVTTEGEMRLRLFFGDGYVRTTPRLGLPDIEIEGGSGDFSGNVWLFGATHLLGIDPMGELLVDRELPQRISSLTPWRSGVLLELHDGSWMSVQPNTDPQQQPPWVFVTLLGSTPTTVATGLSASRWIALLDGALQQGVPGWGWRRIEGGAELHDSLVGIGAFSDPNSWGGIPPERVETQVAEGCLVIDRAPESIDGALVHGRIRGSTLERFESQERFAPEGVAVALGSRTCAVIEGTALTLLDVSPRSTLTPISTATLPAADAWWGQESPPALWGFDGENCWFIPIREVAQLRHLDLHWMLAPRQPVGADFLWPLVGNFDGVWQGIRLPTTGSANAQGSALDAPDLCDLVADGFYSSPQRNESLTFSTAQVAVALGGLSVEGGAGFLWVKPQRSAADCTQPQQSRVLFQLRQQVLVDLHADAAWIAAHHPVAFAPHRLRSYSIDGGVQRAGEWRQRLERNPGTESWRMCRGFVLFGEPWRIRVELDDPPQTLDLWELSHPFVEAECEVAVLDRSSGGEWCGLSWTWGNPVAGGDLGNLQFTSRTSRGTDVSSGAATRAGWNAPGVLSFAPQHWGVQLGGSLELDEHSTTGVLSARAFRGTFSGLALSNLSTAIDLGDRQGDRQGDSGGNESGAADDVGDGGDSLDRDLGFDSPFGTNETVSQFGTGGDVAESGAYLRWELTRLQGPLLELVAHGVAAPGTDLEWRVRGTRVEGEGVFFVHRGWSWRPPLAASDVHRWQIELRWKTDSSGFRTPLVEGLTATALAARDRMRVTAVVQAPSRTPEE